MLIEIDSLDFFMLNVEKKKHIPNNLEDTARRWVGHHKFNSVILVYIW
jgi:hypothetical protein